MARKRATHFVDDCDGSSVSADEVSIIQWAYRGAEYVIDLSPANAAAFDAAVAPWRKVSRKVGRRRIISTSTARSGSSKEIRDWARSQGFEVSDRGRLPSDVVRAFHARRVIRRPDRTAQA